MADPALIRTKILAAASSASGATMDLIETARNGKLRRRDLNETLTQLVDAIRLTQEAIETDAAGEEVILHEQQVVAVVTRIVEGE